MNVQTMVSERKNPLETEAIPKLIAKYSIPSIISFIVSSIYNILDQIYIGHTVGVVGMAATNVAFPITTITAAVSLLIATGSAANFNLKQGAGNEDGARKSAGTGLCAATILGVVMMLLCFMFIKPMLYFFGAEEHIMPMAIPYAAITIAGIPFAIIGTVENQLIRADGSPRFTMMSLLVGSLINVVLDPIFVFVLDWGIEGLALSSTLGQIITFAISTYYMIKCFKSVKFSKRDFKLRSKYMKMIAAVGAGSCVNQLAMSVVQITLNNVLVRHGQGSVYGSDIPIGVVGAISKINIIYMSFTLGVSQGIQPIVSYNYGAKNYKRVRHTVRHALLVVSVMAFVALFVFQVFPRQIISIFGQGGELYFKFAVSYLRIFLLVTFTGAIQPLTANYCNAIGKAKMGIFMSLTRQIIFLMPLIVVLPRFLGIDGVLFSGPIADTAAAILALVIILREMRLLKEKEKEQQLETV